MNRPNRAGFFLPLACLLCGLTAQVQADERLQRVLLDIYRNYPEIQYQGSESVVKKEVDQYGAQKYMVLDFSRRQELPEKDLQASIHKICMSVLGNADLVRDLSNQGYDMVSVSFDPQSQYDCL